MEELIKMAAEKGVCCANCVYSKPAALPQKCLCGLLYDSQIEWLINDFCSDFQPKDEKND